jgi:hypothetical protein
MPTEAIVAVMADAPQKASQEFTQQLTAIHSTQQHFTATKKTQFTRTPFFKAQGKGACK